MKIRYLCAILALISGNVFPDQTFYKCVTEKGGTLYSDMPCPGAVKLSVSTTANIVPPVHKTEVLDENRPNITYFPQNSTEKAVTGYTYAYSGGQISSPEPIPGWFLYNLVQFSRQNKPYSHYFGLKRHDFRR